MVQSMTNTDTRDVEATLAQIDRLVRRGCEAVRVAVPDMTAAKALRALRDGSPVPLIADIHFDYRLALAALEAGLEGLRINPQATSGPASMWIAWWMPPRPTAASSGWASIPVPWKSICCRSTAALCVRPWWRARSAMCACWRTGASTIPRSPSSPLRCSIPLRAYRLLCKRPATTRCTSASPRRAALTARQPSSPLWVWAFCCTRASATPCASRSTAAPAEEMTVAWETPPCPRTAPCAGRRSSPVPPAGARKSTSSASRSAVERCAAHGNHGGHQGRGHGLCGQRPR